MPSLEGLPEKFRNAISAFLKALEENFKGGFSVYLFGSLARGDYLLDSDIDIIVVMEELRSLKPWERTAMLRRIAPKDVGFDIIGYCEEEFKRMREYFEPLLRLR
ncbi:MAG: nucleotidyltransferase domain-containing protein [Candidatus Bathyarchaeia archaeon]